MGKLPGTHLCIGTGHLGENSFVVRENLMIGCPILRALCEGWDKQRLALNRTVIDCAGNLCIGVVETLQNFMTVFSQ